MTNYEKISESNGTKSKFDGDGIPFKAKLIGMEDLSVDRDEKVCLDSMFKLKAVVRARGEHKQKIQLNLTLFGLKIFDDATKVLLASHEINRVSYVVMDPRDTRAFGYIYITTDNRLQFWAIKTERTAATTVLALKELFDLAFERLKSPENTEEQVNPTTPTPASTENTSVSTQKTRTESIPVSPLQQPPKPVPPPIQPPTTSNSDNIWGDNPSTVVPRPSHTSQQQSQPEVNLWDFNAPAVPLQKPPPPRPANSLIDAFDLLAPTQTAVSTVPTDDLFSMFSAPTSTLVASKSAIAESSSIRPQSSSTNPTARPLDEFDLLGDFSTQSTTT